MVTEVSTDSRSIPAGALFVPLVGERFDGHDYLDAALAGGAAGCLTAKKPFPYWTENSTFRCPTR